MSHPPRIAYAVAGTTSRLHAPQRQLPIVVVPDFLGTRLSDGKKLVWNPFGAPFGQDPGVFTVDYKRLDQPTELTPDETNRYRLPAHNNSFKPVKHFFNLVTATYGGLVKRLMMMRGGAFEQHGVRPKVYCCGYDWRLDNARSALRLAAVIDEALAETRETRCIVIAHGMGALVARYYCRVLGGESRVHQLIQLGCPTLGLPKAFLALKHGLGNPFGLEMAQGAAHAAGGESAAAVEAVAEGAQMAAGLTGMLVGLAAGGGADAAFEYLNLPYLALSLGAGRMLRRAETIAFLRKLPALYQLMPNAIYCEDNPHWIVFDPLATGYKPTGYMIVLPTVLTTSVDIAAGVADGVAGAVPGAGEQLRRDVLDALAPGRAERTSPRASRNMDTLPEVMAEIGHILTVGTTTDPSQLAELAEVGEELMERAEAAFFNGKNSYKLYTDIYTGLLDRVEHRATAAGNLALAFRFDRALTLRPRYGEAPSGLELIEQLLSPITTELAVAGEHLFSGRYGEPGVETSIRQRRRTEQERREREHHATAPRMYVHPNTVNVYGEGHLGELGCVILPTDIASLDDHNVVRQELMPIPTGSPGDGMVPTLSGNPAAEKLTRPYFLARGFHLGHDGLARSNEVFDYVRQRIEAAVVTYCGIREEEAGS